MLLYLVPLAVGALLCATTWPAQVDHLAEDEIREAMRAFALQRGEVDWWQSWMSSVHPPLVPAVAARCLDVLPASVALRVPALLSAFAVVLLVVWIGRRIGGDEVALLAGLLVAASPAWWAYGCAISLDLPFACFATVGVAAVARPQRSLALACIAAVGAALTKRFALALVATAMLLACFAGQDVTRLDRRIPMLMLGAVVVVAAFGAWQYLGAGHAPFGGAIHIDDLVGTAPVLVGCALAGIALVGLAYRWCRPAACCALQPLMLFGAPLAIAPMIGQAPAPRYFLPLLPVAALVLAVIVWQCGAKPRRRLRWALSIALLLVWWGAQTRDLQQSYWPYQRGHGDAVTWLARNAPDSVVLSPEGSFLELAALLEGTSGPPLVNLDRTTCARLEDRLAASGRPAWVVLPLFRSLGWPPDFEQHAAAMGLRLRALVRRDVWKGDRQIPWDRAAVETMGPEHGVPMIALLSVEAPPDRALLAAREPLSLVRFVGPESVTDWYAEAVDIRGCPEGIAVEFGEGGVLHARNVPELAVVSSADWHHHRWLELQVRADQRSLDELDALVGLRNATFHAPLSEVRRVAGQNRTRLLIDLEPWPFEETSRVRWFGLSRRQPGPQGGPRPRVELLEVRLLPDGG